MKKKNEVPQPIYSEDFYIRRGRPNEEYEVDDFTKATPYYNEYYNAWRARPYMPTPPPPVIPPEKPLPRRMFWVVMTGIFTLVFVVAMALSYLEIVPEYTALFEKVTVADGTDEEALESIDGEADIAKPDNIYIGVDDIIGSALKKWATIGMDKDFIYYDECLQNIENVENMGQMIAYYALPVSLLLSLIIGVYILIKIITACASRKRKKLPYIALLFLLFNLIGAVAGFVWAAEPMANITGFLFRSGEKMILGFGYIIMIGAQVLALVCSMFAYRSRKKSRY